MKQISRQSFPGGSAAATRWRRKILTHPADAIFRRGTTKRGDDKVRDARGNTVCTVPRTAFIDLSKSREPANPLDRPTGRPALSPQLKDRIQAIKRSMGLGLTVID